MPTAVVVQSGYMKSASVILLSYITFKCDFVRSLYFSFPPVHVCSCCFSLSCAVIILVVLHFPCMQSVVDPRKNSGSFAVANGNPTKRIIIMI